MLKVHINGDAQTLENPLSVSDLLKKLHLDSSPCAVEINQEVVPKRSHRERNVEDGDVIEIVTLVGGG